MGGCAGAQRPLEGPPRTVRVQGQADAPDEGALSAKRAADPEGRAKLKMALRVAVLRGGVFLSGVQRAAVRSPGPAGLRPRRRRRPQQAAEGQPAFLVQAYTICQVELRVTHRTPFTGLALAAGILLAPNPAQAADCTLVHVSSADTPSLRVYFTRFAREDKTGGKYKKCRIVKTPAEDSKTFLITPFRQDANLIVLRSRWPRG